MAGTEKKLYGPAYVVTPVANIYVPSSALIYGKIGHIRLVNASAAAATVTLYVGATGGSAGGTEILKDWNIAIAGEKDLYFPAGLKLLSTQFLTGIASAGSAIVITVMGWEGVV